MGDSIDDLMKALSAAIVSKTTVVPEGGVLSPEQTQKFAQNLIKTPSLVQQFEPPVAVGEGDQISVHVDPGVGPDEAFLVSPGAPPVKIKFEKTVPGPPLSEVLAPKFKKLSNVVSVTGPLVAGLKGTVSVASDFEAQLKKLETSIESHLLTGSGTHEEENDMAKIEYIVGPGSILFGEKINLTSKVMKAPWPGSCGTCGLKFPKLTPIVSGGPGVPVRHLHCWMGAKKADPDFPMHARALAETIILHAERLTLALHFWRDTAQQMQTSGLCIAPSHPDPVQHQWCCAHTAAPWNYNLTEPFEGIS